MKNLLVLIRLSKNKKKPENFSRFKVKSSNLKNQRQISINKIGNFCIKTIFHEHERQYTWFALMSQGEVWQRLDDSLLPEQNTLHLSSSYDLSSSVFCQVSIIFFHTTLFPFCSFLIKHNLLSRLTRKHYLPTYASWYSYTLTQDLNSNVKHWTYN